jgi:hypothetical protein
MARFLARHFNCAAALQLVPDALFFVKNCKEDR